MSVKVTSPIVQSFGRMSRKTDVRPARLPFVSRRLDSDFGERLRQAADKKGIPYEQTKIGNYLGVPKQKVDGWMNGSLPRADTLFEIADKLGADPRWLATGALTNEKNVYDGVHKKSEKILSVVKTLLNTDDKQVEEIVEAVQALVEENGTAGKQRGRTRRAPRL